MRAVTIRQPWAYAIAHLGKNVENRTLAFAHRYRGEVAIHAGQGWSPLGAETIKDLPVREDMPRGAVVAVATVTEIHESGVGCKPPAGCSPWAMHRDVNGDRCLHLVLENVRVLATPVPVSGRLGLWSLPAEVETAVLEQLGGGVDVD